MGCCRNCEQLGSVCVCVCADVGGVRGAGWRSRECCRITGFTEQQSCYLTADRPVVQSGCQGLCDIYGRPSRNLFGKWNLRCVHDENENVTVLWEFYFFRETQVSVMWPETSSFHEVKTFSQQIVLKVWTSENYIFSFHYPCVGG